MPFILLLGSIIIVLPQNTIAKADKIDSLRNEYYKYENHDTNSIPVLINLSFHLSQSKFIDSLSKYVGILKTKIANTKTPSNYSQAYTLEGDLYYHNRIFDSALAFFHKALTINKANNYKYLTTSQYNNIGNVYLRMADYEKALNYYDTTISIAKEVGDSTVLANTINNVATIYYEQGAYVIALEKFLTSLKLNEDKNRESSMVSNYNNITNIYFRLNEYNKAKQYATKSMELSEKIGAPWGLVSSYTTFAMIHNKLEEYDSSLYYLQKADTLAHKIGSSFLTNLLKQNIAECYLNKKQYDKAFKLYKESEINSQKLNDPEGYAVAKAGIGQVLMKKGNKADGAGYLKEAVELMTARGMKEQVLEIATILSDACEKSNDYKGAVKYLRIKEQYKDSLNKVEGLKQAQNLEFKYLLDKKENELTLMQKDRDIETSRLNLQRTLLIAALIGMIMAIIIAILIFRNLKTARLKNQLILNQKAEIEQQAQKLTELNNFKDTTFSVLSHDLRSPINALTGTMAMLDEGIITPEEFAEHKNELNNKLQSVSLMLDNLLQWAKAQMKGEQTLDIQKISIRRKVLRSIAVLKDAAQQKNITLNGNAPEGLYAYADRNQVEMVMRNLLSNAIKFTPDNGSVTISAEKQGDKAVIKVKDTGVGMAPDMAAELFDGSPNSSTQGTGGEKGTGIGLHLSYTFVKNNNGELTVQSEPGTGTTFTLTLPTTPPA